MSKAFTIVLGLIFAGAASIAGYIYYTGESLPGKSSCSTKIEDASMDDGCPLCAAAKQRSCCSGESSAKLLAMTGAKASLDFNCCELGSESIANAASGVVGGSAFAIGHETTSALSSLVGIAATSK